MERDNTRVFVWCAEPSPRWNNVFICHTRCGASAWGLSKFGSTTKKVVRWQRRGSHHRNRVVNFSFCLTSVRVAALKIEKMLVSHEILTRIFRVLATIMNVPEERMLSLVLFGSEEANRKRRRSEEEVKKMRRSDEEVTKKWRRNDEKAKKKRRGSDEEATKKRRRGDVDA